MNANEVLRLGVTDTMRPEKYEQYVQWIRRVDPAVELIRLSYVLKNEAMINTVDGLILTGGGDVHPDQYGLADAISSVNDVNVARDEFEFEVIERALDTGMPILGICRGLQVMNVYLGGTLIIDLTDAGYSNHAIPEDGEMRHTVEVIPGTMLEGIVGPGTKKVNSSHHQAADRLGKGLIPSARSEDGVTEAAEWALKDRMPFLLLMQWHPERIVDEGNPCAGAVAKFFLREVSLFNSTKKRDHTSDQETEQLNHG